MNEILPPRSFAEAIDLWPSVTEFAEDADCKLDTAMQMKRRNRINEEYWLGIIAGAKRRGFALITLELFAEFADQRRREKTA